MKSDLGWGWVFSVCTIVFVACAGFILRNFKTPVFSSSPSMPKCLEILSQYLNNSISYNVQRHILNVHVIVSHAIGDNVAS